MPPEYFMHESTVETLKSYLRSKNIAYDEYKAHFFFSKIHHAFKDHRTVQIIKESNHIFKDFLDKFHQKKTELMTFGMAFEAMEKGLKVARKSWTILGFYRIGKDESEEKHIFDEKGFNVSTGGMPGIDLMANDWQVVDE